MKTSQIAPVRTSTPIITETIETSLYAPPPRLIPVPRRLDSVSSIQFLENYQRHFPSHVKVRTIILDFSKTDFIDSCGLAALKAIAKRAKHNDTQLVAWSVQPIIHRALSLSGCDRLLNIDGRTQALTNTPPANDPLPAAHPSATHPLKRACDIVGALVGLGITALVYAPIAIAIKLDSSGPVLFRQTRFGYLGQPITIWKFRSMAEDAESRKAEVASEIEGALFKNAADPRITRVGKFLRRTSLDELPQFWSVLMGDMSLVGTRPPTADEVEQYEIAHWERLNVKPGMTGEWQVSGRSLVKSFEDVIALDRSYQRKWSPLYDIQLLVKTLRVLATKKAGAV